jgi:hypothetical protein
MPYITFKKILIRDSSQSLGTFLPKRWRLRKGSAFSSNCLSVLNIQIGESITYSQTDFLKVWNEIGGLWASSNWGSTARRTNDTLLGGLQLFMIWRILLTTRITTLFEVFGHHLLHDDPEFLITCSLYLNGRSFWKYK